MEEQIKSEIKAMTDDVKSWYQRTPWVQRARQRLTEDLDKVVTHLDAATSDLQEKVRPFIDPPRDQPASASESAGGPGETASAEARPSERPAGSDPTVRASRPDASEA